MRSFFTFLFCTIFLGVSYAQGPIPDAHPDAVVYVIDPQSAQQVLVTTDAAVAFKNALIDLVRNTNRARTTISMAGPAAGSRFFVISQMGVETNVNGYQVELQQQGQNQNTDVYSFAYHIDDNTLYFYAPDSQQWLPEPISPDNAFNLRKTAYYAKEFNQELANQGPQNAQVSADSTADLNAPVDTSVVADTPPPAMPDYQQPECPTDGYMWQPGYWGYSPYRNDYYWVPGAWVAPPAYGLLWTPSYWGYDGARYVFHVGYWGNSVGFYGGINYGYGYSGRGYYGGQWQGGHFAYNTAVVRVNTTVVHNTYVNNTVVNNNVVNNHSSFNGRGGVTAKPNSAEIAAMNQRHFKPTAEQNSNQLQAKANPNQFHRTNPGGQPVLASPKVAPYHPKGNNGFNGANLSRPVYPNQPAKTQTPANTQQKTQFQPENTRGQQPQPQHPQKQGNNRPRPIPKPKPKSPPPGQPRKQ